MTAASRDAVAVVEAVYALDESEDSWRERLLDAVEPVLSPRIGLAAMTFQRTAGGGFELAHFTARGRREVCDSIPEAVSAAPPMGTEALLLRGPAAKSLSEVMAGRDASFESRFRESTAGLASDALGLACDSCSGQVLWIASALSRPRRATAPERRHLNRLAAHIGAGLRLRQRIENLDLHHGEAAEAIFNADGEVLDARGRATAASAQDRLRRAVLRIQQARGPLRHIDPARALSLWHALVAGRWSLVDHFDADGSHMVVAVKNAPQVRDPRGLSNLQVTVAEEFGKGNSTKRIAYVLGVSTSAVSNALFSVREKLGLRSSAQVAAFFAPSGVRASLDRLDLDDATMLFARYGSSSAPAFSALTAAEKDVALLLLQGATNANIASRRKCTYNTVANQVKSIYAKLGVCTRTELTLFAAEASDIQGSVAGGACDTACRTWR